MRHDRVFLDGAGWRAVWSGDAALHDRPDIELWAARGWPLVRRRRLPGEAEPGVPLGLALPPAGGKRRLRVLVPETTVAAVLPALDLSDARAAAPLAWQPTLDALAALTDDHGQRVQVFGSLAWATTTGLPYLTSDSDLDLMLAVSMPADPGAVVDALATIARQARMRIDAELVRPDGAALAWRELAAVEGLVKHEGGAAAMRPADFLAGCVP